MWLTRGWPNCIKNFRTVKRAVRGYAERPRRLAGHWMMRFKRRMYCNVPTLSCEPPSTGLSKRKPGMTVTL